MRLTVETQPDGSAAVFELRPVLVAHFKDAALADLFIAWARQVLNPARETDRADENEPVTQTGSGDDVDAAITALSDADTARAPDPAPEEIAPDASPASALPVEPAPEEIAPALDPYHEAGEAFRRLKAGDKLGAVADDLRLDMPQLRSRWARYQKGLQALAWQPGATVAKPPVAVELDDGWTHCTRCKTKFNAARAQGDLGLSTRPTRCAACRT